MNNNKTIRSRMKTQTLKTSLVSPTDASWLSQQTPLQGEEGSSWIGGWRDITAACSRPNTRLPSPSSWEGPSPRWFICQWKCIPETLWLEDTFLSKGKWCHLLFWMISLVQIRWHHRDTTVTSLKHSISDKEEQEMVKQRSDRLFSAESAAVGLSVTVHTGSVAAETTSYHL